MSDFSLEPIGVSPPARTRTSAGWQVLTAVLAVACAVLAFLLVRPDAQDGPTRTAASTAALACAVLAEAEPAAYPIPGTESGMVALNRLGVVIQLAATARAQDPAYAEFSEALQAVTFSRVRADTEGPESSSAMGRAQQACAELPVG